MLISPFTPLFFRERRSDGVPSRYVQTFAPTDHILLEVFTSGDEAVSVSVVELSTGKEYALHCLTYVINAETTLVHNVITGLSPGEYTVRIGGIESHPFRVSDDPEELSQTTLIQYSMSDNKKRTDAMFLIGGMRYFFDFRVPGGFKDSGWTFGVDNEQFVTPDGDPVELYALESTQQKFTLGWQEGVPVDHAELLNRLLTCTYVYFDGIRYARKDSSIPEMTVQIDGLDSFVFGQLLQRVNNLDPTIETANHIAMRRIDATAYRRTDNNNNRTIY